MLDKIKPPEMLALLRKRAGLSQAEFGRMVGQSEDTISRAERGHLRTATIMPWIREARELAEKAQRIGTDPDAPTG